MKQRYAAIVLITIALVSVVAFFFLRSGNSTVLIAENNRFNDNNPQIKVILGYEHRITIKNRDDGRWHNLKIPAFNIDTGTVLPGEEVSVVLTPDKAGDFDYYCSFHRTTMKGVVTVVRGKNDP